MLKVVSENNLHKFYRFFLLIFSCLIISACQGGSHYRKLSREDPKNIKYRGHYKIGNEYTVKDVTYKPREVKNFTQEGIASWYGHRAGGFHGKSTSNGDIYNKNTLSAAHNTLQLPCLVKVTNLENNKSIIVMVNDRGPHSQDRIIDLSQKAAEIIDVKKMGSARVKLEFLAQETKSFLTIIGLEAKAGSKSKHAIFNRKCSVNCQVKLINMQHNIQVDKI